MHLRTLSWSSVSSKNNIHITPSIQIFCVDINNKSVYVRLEALSTTILGFKNDITKEDFDNIQDTYQPKEVAGSRIFDNVVAMRNPTLNYFISDENQINAFEQDPQGLLSSFWEVRHLKPYDWIYVEKYELLNKKYTNCDIEIRTEEKYVHSFSSDVKISTRKLFWDIEVISPDRNFTDAKNPAHEIFMISVISEINNKVTAYILTTKKIGEFPEAIIEKYETEKEMIIGFFNLWNQITPNRVMSYNGDSYDMPYVLDRAKFYKIQIPSLSKLLSPAIVTKLPHPSFIGTEWDRTVISPGVEKLDLITYFRRFYPGNENYRLETIGKLFLGEGKSGLEIEEMFKIVESNDPVKMKIVAYYSYKDSLLLYDLYKKLDVENKIENICNDIYCTADELLRLNDKDLISRMFYHADYGTKIIGELIIDKISHLIPFSPGVYAGIYVNKYDELFDLALSMNTTNVDYIDIIRTRIKHLPTYMKSMIVYSNYVPLDIKDHLKTLINNIDGIIAIDDNFIYTKFTDPNTNLSLVDKYDYLFVITPFSMIYSKNNEFTKIGLHTITRPKYEYIKIAVDSYLSDYINGKKVSGRRTTTKELSSVDKNLFIINTKIKPLSSYKDKRLIKYKISESITDMVITTWINVKYINTTKGFKIIKDKVDDNDILDYKNYVKEINEIYKILDMIVK